MDPDRRKQLVERRAFMQRRNRARAFREGAEPAVSVLEKAGEAFRLHGPEGRPRWGPTWIPSGYSYLPWSILPGVVESESLDEAALAIHCAQLIYVRARPEMPLLVVFEGRRMTLELDRDTFVRHAEVILESCWFNAYIAQPPAQWLVHVQGHRTLHKDH